MPWSIFTDGGGSGAALTWAVDLLKGIGAPLSKGNEQFVYDWEVSEGGGGKYNPLNQGPVPGQPGLTTTGSQFGGGAADFASWQAGLTGAADYLGMPNFSAIKDALVQNNPAQARSALIASPWAASHYGNGSAFSDKPIPGQASALPGIGAAGAGTGNDAQTTGIISGLEGIPGAITSAVSGFGNDLKTTAITSVIVLAGGAVVVWGLARASGLKQKTQEAAGTAATIGAMAA